MKIHLSLSISMNIIRLLWISSILTPLLVWCSSISRTQHGRLMPRIGTLMVKGENNCRKCHSLSLSPRAVNFRSRLVLQFDVPLSHLSSNIFSNKYPVLALLPQPSLAGYLRKQAFGLHNYLEEGFLREQVDGLNNFLRQTQRVQQAPSSLKHGLLQTNSNIFTEIKTSNNRSYQGAKAIEHSQENTLIANKSISHRKSEVELCLPPQQCCQALFLTTSAIDYRSHLACSSMVKLCLLLPTRLVPEPAQFGATWLSSVSHN